MGTAACGGKGFKERARVSGGQLQTAIQPDVMPTPAPRFRAWTEKSGPITVRSPGPAIPRQRSAQTPPFGETTQRNTLVLEPFSEFDHGLSGEVGLMGGCKGGRKSGYQRLDKRLEGILWRVQTGWRAVARGAEAVGMADRHPKEGGGAYNPPHLKLKLPFRCRFHY